MAFVEVAFATKEQQKIITVEFADDITISEAISKSDIQALFPEYNLQELAVGVFGKRLYELEKYKVKHGDRIEIYRSLSKTPNQKRLDRAKNK